MSIMQIIALIGVLVGVVNLGLEVRKSGKRNFVVSLLLIVVSAALFLVSGMATQKLVDSRNVAAPAPAVEAEVKAAAPAEAEVKADAAAPAEAAEAKADVAEAPAEAAEAKVDVAEAPAEAAEAKVDVAEAPAEAADAGSDDFEIDLNDPNLDPEIKKLLEEAARLEAEAAAAEAALRELENAE